MHSSMLEHLITEGFTVAGSMEVVMAAGMVGGDKESEIC